MKTMSYEERVAALGIERGRLGVVNGFDDDPASNRIGTALERGLVNPNASMRVSLPPITEDLSRFVLKETNDGRSRRAGVKSRPGLRGVVGNVRPELQEFYRLLSKRGLTLTTLASQCGMSNVWLGKLLVRGAGCEALARVREFLTAAEWEVLPRGEQVGKRESGKVGASISDAVERVPAR